MKSQKRFLVFLVAVLVISLSMVALVACNKIKSDPETRPFVMSIQQPDGVFNPFFSTSAYDSEVIGLTQISMLSTDMKGNLVYGENEPTVVKDYYTEEEKENDKVKYTTYNFLIKNGIKWSDGEPLTIKDVIFNLYVYLDPAYTGSATIYSTDIVGLKQYRTQKANLSDGGVDDFEKGFRDEAKIRIQSMIDYVGFVGSTLKPEDKTNPIPYDKETEEAKYLEYETKLLTDYAYTARTFYQELLTDWNNSDVESYKDWGITEKWQVFLLNDGHMTEFLQKDKQGNFVKDDKGNNQLNKEAANDFFVDAIVREYLVPEGLATYNEENGTVTYAAGKETEVQEAIKNACVDTVFFTYFSSTFPKTSLTRRTNTFVIGEGETGENVGKEREAIANAAKRTNYNQFQMVVQGWMTATTVLEKFTAEQKSEYFKKLGSSRPYKTVTGITIKEGVTEFHGNQLGAKYDVLSIKINGVDPKAIYNFSFNVAPMHYYSTTNWNGKNYIDSFDYENGEFGFEVGDSKFMDEVINSTDKIKLPMGAGPYKAAFDDGAKFYDLNMVYYVRNENFKTVGSGLENAKIKNVRYKVVASDQIINSLKRGDIDFGDPSATQDNINMIKGEKKKLSYMTVDTNGYGYVGINPAFVPDVDVRRLIMKAMWKQLILDNYYKGGLASLIDRPMSKTSWAYPESAKTYVSASDGIGEHGLSYAYEPDLKKYEQILIDKGYDKVNGVYQKTIPGFGVDRLDYKFTIAGGSNDHPAYAMFLNAQKILNAIGFDVKVVNSQTALSDLSSGKLAVWAAAWSSTIDPDMYQVYHKESQASSTKNWGYSQILGSGGSGEAWGDEYRIVQELSQLIDDGRNTDSKNARITIYGRALDKIMELAVEFPTYQRKDMSAYRKGLINEKTMPKESECSPYSGLLSRIWEIDYNH